jgi:hypothetical protein
MRDLLEDLLEETCDLTGICERGPKESVSELRMHCGDLLLNERQAVKVDRQIKRAGIYCIQLARRSSHQVRL